MQIMFQQLRPGNSYARISWQDLFAAMKVYCERYSLGPEQQQVGFHSTYHQITASKARCSHLTTQTLRCIKCITT